MRVRRASSCRSALILLVILGLAASVDAAPAGASSPPSIAALRDGVNLSFNPGGTIAESEREIGLASELHAHVLRVSIAWAAFAPYTSAVQPRQLAMLDALVADASSHGIGIILEVDYTPCWASSAPPALLRRCSPGTLGAANAWPPRQPSLYAGFTATLAERYGSKLAAVEVWNEPDQSNQAYFAGPHKAQRYAALLRAAYPAIKRANPSVPVLGGSIVGSNGAFLRALYKAGIKGYYNGLSVHFYTLTLAALHSIHTVQLANGDHTSLWLDEFGWGSCWPRAHAEQGLPCVTSQVQADNLRNTVRTLASTPYVAASVVYTLQDSSTQQFGLLSVQGQRKLAFGALSEAFADPLGPTAPVTLIVRRSAHSIVASGSAPVGDYMGLEASVGGVLRYRAVFTLNRFNRYSLTLPAALGTQRVTVRVFPYWSTSVAAVEATS
jgi:hypothetical protein